jgi:hypothetical protein
VPVEHTDVGGADGWFWPESLALWFGWCDAMSHLVHRFT